jgi:hypothetical protein
MGKEGKAISYSLNTDNQPNSFIQKFVCILHNTFKNLITLMMYNLWIERDKYKNCNASKT